MIATFSPQHEGSRVFSHPLHVQCVGKLWPSAEVPMAIQQQQGRWLRWQQLLLCHLYIFLRPPTCKPPSVPLDLRKCPSRQWLQGARVSSTPADLSARRGMRQQWQGAFVPAACRACDCSQKHPGKVFCPATSSTSTAIRSANLSAGCLMFLQTAQFQPVALPAA